MKKRLLFILLIVINMLGTTVLAKEEMSAEYTYVDKLFEYAVDMYVDESLDKDEILKNAINKYLEENPDAVIDILKAGFSQIDDYTEFYTAEEYISYINDINHTFYGIGVIIQKDGEYIKVVGVLEDGTAIKAGIQIDDLISKVDGVEMRGKTIDEVQQAVVGELGTPVEVTVIRGNEEITYNLLRAKVNSTTVSHIILDDKTAYVSVINFAQNTSQEFSQTLAELDEKGIENIILDLRNNPGGYLISAVEIGQMIVPEGVIVKTMFRQSENNEIFYSNLKNPKYKFAVLVNENTASAAEILTGALQDSKVGVVIGEQTFGKAVIQDMFNMRDYNAIKITTGRYLTRNGREINGVGLEPDIEVLNYTVPIDVTKYDTINYQSTSKISDINDNIPQIKERLSILGYVMSNYDNVFDNELEAAVLDFQNSKGLAPTGRLDTVTMVQIENAFAQAEVLSDEQLYTAYEHFGGTREKFDEIINNQ